jgi:hypothetical protein
MSYDVLTPAAARLWPYAPDWTRTVDVKRSFLTDLIASNDGTEQRRAIRDNPRISLSYQATVSRADRRNADHNLRAWQNKPVVVPDFARWARLTGSSSGGATALTISPMPVWVAANQPLVLCKEGVLEEVLVLSASGSTINLAAPLVNAWASDDVLRPSFFGLFGGQISSSRPNGGTATIDVSLDCYPAGVPPRATGTAWAMLNGIEVFTPLPDFASPPSVGYLWPLSQVDYGHGRTAQFREVDFMARTFDAQFSGLGVSTASQVEQFFDRMKGHRGAFYSPTWESDFAPLSFGSSSFVASGSQLATDFAATDFATVNEGVAVCLADGTVLYRRITDVAASSGNSAVTVDSAWGVSLSTANVVRISRLVLSRFGSDDLTMSWRTSLSAQTRLTFQQVKA